MNHIFTYEENGAPMCIVFDLKTRTCEPSAPLVECGGIYTVTWNEQWAEAISNFYGGPRPGQNATAQQWVERLLAIAANNHEWASVGVVNTSIYKMMNGVHPNA